MSLLPECADQETDKIARDLMIKLENELPSKLPESNINTYNLSWEPKEGIVFFNNFVNLVN